MSRARVGDGLLVLLAVAAVVAPVRTLFTPDSWIPMALLLAVVVSAEYPRWSRSTTLTLSLYG